MNIETKFNYNEKVFVIVNDQITLVRISKIRVEANKSINIWYEVNWDGDKYISRNETNIYKTKEDIIK